MSQLTCKKCQSVRYVKSGHTRGHQRYQCMNCGCQFTNTKHRGVHPALKSFAIVLYAYCGVSMGKIARLYKISTVAVLKWIKTAALEAKPINPVSESDIVMIDEVLAFCEWKKNKIWIWRAIDGVSRRPLGWQLGHRGDACAKRLISKVDLGTSSFVTDERDGFFRLLSEERHFPGKDLTFPIEATNSDIRHNLARFHRRSKVTSRSKDMVEASLLLFHHLQSQEILDSLSHPLLSSFG